MHVNNNENNLKEILHFMFTNRCSYFIITILKMSNQKNVFLSMPPQMFYFYEFSNRLLETICILICQGMPTDKMLL